MLLLLLSQYSSPFPSIQAILDYGCFVSKIFVVSAKCRFLYKLAGSVQCDAMPCVIVPFFFSTIKHSHSVFVVLCWFRCFVSFRFIQLDDDGDGMQYCTHKNIIATLNYDCVIWRCVDIWCTRLGILRYPTAKHAIHMCIMLFLLLSAHESKNART